MILWHVYCSMHCHHWSSLFSYVRGQSNPRTRCEWCTRMHASDFDLVRQTMENALVVAKFRYLLSNVRFISLIHCSTSLQIHITLASSFEYKQLNNNKAYSHNTSLPTHPENGIVQKLLLYDPLPCRCHNLTVWCNHTPPRCCRCNRQTSHAAGLENGTIIRSRSLPFRYFTCSWLLRTTVREGFDVVGGSDWCFSIGLRLKYYVDLYSLFTYGHVVFLHWLGLRFVLGKVRCTT